MCCTRRSVIFVAVGIGLPLPTRAATPRELVAAAFAMREKAVAAGDQAYGAVVARNNEIVGRGPSRVRELGEWVGHAEREALRDAQRRLGRDDLSDCVMYSTSRPCGTCQRAAAEAKLARMFHGTDAADAGKP
jgi:tRNA(Arg) A34 adenosine deaminase TadA